VYEHFLPTSTKRVQPSSRVRENQQLPIKDPALARDMVKTWMWLPALIVLLILACLVMSLQYEMPIGESLLALFLAFFFSFLAIQSTGATGLKSQTRAKATINPYPDITPLTAASKASQVILGATTKGQGWTVERAQTLNLMGGALASIGAGQAAGNPFIPPLAMYLLRFTQILLAISVWVSSYAHHQNFNGLLRVSVPASRYSLLLLCTSCSLSRIHA
jgi:hypothetical protein